MARLTKRGITRARNREPLLNYGYITIDHHYNVSDLDFMFQILLNLHAKIAGEDVQRIMHRLVDRKNYVREAHQRKMIGKG